MNNQPPNNQPPNNQPPDRTPFMSVHTAAHARAAADLPDAMSPNSPLGDHDIGLGGGGAVAPLPPSPYKRRLASEMDEQGSGNLDAAETPAEFEARMQEEKEEKDLRNLLKYLDSDLESEDKERNVDIELEF